jgi:hypothetical protein
MSIPFKSRDRVFQFYSSSKRGCHAEPFDVAQGRLRKESITAEILRRSAPQNDDRKALKVGRQFNSGSIASEGSAPTSWLGALMGHYYDNGPEPGKGFEVSEVVALEDIYDQPAHQKLLADSEPWASSDGRPDRFHPSFCRRESKVRCLWSLSWKN